MATKMLTSLSDEQPPPQPRRIGEPMVKGALILVLASIAVAVVLMAVGGQIVAVLSDVVAAMA
jgi:hypothetical protein